MEFLKGYIPQQLTPFIFFQKCSPEGTDCSGCSGVFGWEGPGWLRAAVL